MEKLGEETESDPHVLLLWEGSEVHLKAQQLGEIGNPIDCSSSGGKLYKRSCAVAENLAMISTSTQGTAQLIVYARHEWILEVQKVKSEETNSEIKSKMKSKKNQLS